MRRGCERWLRAVSSGLARAAASLTPQPFARTRASSLVTCSVPRRAVLCACSGDPPPRAAGWTRTAVGRVPGAQHPAPRHPPGCPSCLPSTALSPSRGSGRLRGPGRGSAARCHPEHLWGCQELPPPPPDAGDLCFPRTLTKSEPPPAGSPRPPPRPRGRLPPCFWGCI